MSIKHKAPAILTIAFMANIVILLLFFQYYVIPYIEKGIQADQRETEKLMFQVYDQIDGETREDGILRLEALAGNDLQVSFVVEDAVTKERLAIPDRPDAGAGVSSAISVTLSGRTTILFLKKNDVFLRSLKEIQYQVTRLELILFSISFLVASTIIHHRYLKPLLRLKDEVDHFQRQGSCISLSSRTDELGMLQNSFHRMSRELASEKAKQNRMIASISHDIKTPLTSLMGFSERLLKKEMDKEKQTAYLERIYAQSVNIQSIVNEFDEYLSYSLDSHLQLKETEIAFVYEMLADEYLGDLTEKGVRIEVKNHCGPLAAVPMDMAKMRRVFANIIENSLRHNPTKRHNLASLLSITILIEEDEDAVIFTVEDNGKGIAESELPHVFEPFYTSDNSRKISGLGLSICERIMYSHGGGIRAVNTGEGLAVILYLPKPKAGPIR